MPDPIPVPRDQIERFMRENRREFDPASEEPGYVRVPRGVSGIFDEQGNFRVNPLKASGERLARQRRAAAARRRDDYRRLIQEGRPPEEIAELLQVGVQHVKNVARILNLELAGDAPPGPCAPVAENKNERAPEAASPAETTNEGARESQGRALYGARTGEAGARAPSPASPPAPVKAYPRARSGPASPRAPSTRRGTLEGRGQARRADREGRQDAAAGDACRPADAAGTTERAEQSPAAPETGTRAHYRACHAAGMSNAAIAATMDVSEGHVRKMLWLLGLEANPPRGGGWRQFREWR